MKIKNKHCKQGSLSRFIIMHFVFFNLAVIVSLIVISYISAIIAKRITFSPDIEGFIFKASAVNDAQLAKLNSKKYFGNKAQYIILDEHGTPIYLSDERYYDNYSANELECIQEYEDDSVLYVKEFPDGIPNGKYLLMKESDTQGGKRESRGYLFLDKDLNVLAGNLFSGRTCFTPKELQYLKGLDAYGRTLSKQRYENKDGKLRTLLCMTEAVGPLEYARALNIVNGIKWLIIPIYLVIAITYGYWLITKLKHCLKPLNDAVIGFVNGSAGSLKHYSGPTEFMDIAENFCRLENKLSYSEYERERSDSKRQQLLADISHDLKTPVTVIKGYAAALLDNVVPPSERMLYLDTILRKANMLTVLIETFHEYSKLEHPEMPVLLVRLNICALVQEYFADRYQELTLSGYKISADIPDAPIFCLVDKPMFCRAIENLVNNAVKYNRVGTTVFVLLRCDKDNILLSVCDNGAGIPASLKDTVFEAFITGDPARSCEHGSGLGLAITRKIVTLHHGSIALLQHESMDYTTEFRITLPISEQV